MAQYEKTIYVYENWRGEAPTLLGRLRCGFVRGQETFSFEYDPAWLSSAESSFSLDPDLALYRGRQYVPLNKQLFGLFSDSCPDRWGRLLMRRKEAIDARKEDRKPRKLRVYAPCLFLSMIRSQADDSWWNRPFAYSLAAPSKESPPSSSSISVSMSSPSLFPTFFS